VSRSATLGFIPGRFQPMANQSGVDRGGSSLRRNWIWLNLQAAACTQPSISLIFSSYIQQRSPAGSRQFPLRYTPLQAMAYNLWLLRSDGAAEPSIGGITNCVLTNCTLQNAEYPVLLRASKRAR